MGHPHVGLGLAGIECAHLAFWGSQLFPVGLRQAHIRRESSGLFCTFRFFVQRDCFLLEMKLIENFYAESISYTGSFTLTLI